MKGQVAYPLPWDVSDRRHVPEPLGPAAERQVPADQRDRAAVARAVRSPTWRRRWICCRAGTLYGDRIYQTDLRFTRAIRNGRTTIRPTVSIYNLFNANPVQTYNQNFGPAWLSPTVILQSRFVDIGIQVDF